MRFLFPPRFPPATHPALFFLTPDLLFANWLSNRVIILFSALLPSFFGFPSGCGQTPPLDECSRLKQKSDWPAGAGSWRTPGIRNGLAGPPHSHQAHRLPAMRILRRGTGLRSRRRCRSRGSGRRCRGGLSRLRGGGGMPRGLFLRAEPGRFAQEGAHAIGPHLGRGMQPAEGPHPGKLGRQDVLQQPSHPFQCRQLDRCRAAGGAVAIRPEHLAVGQPPHSPVAGGGFEHVACEIAQRR